MKPVLILALTAACLALPAVSRAEPLVGATAPSGSTADNAFCIRTKGDRARPGECLFASYQECKSSPANVYAECYRNPRSANAQMPKRQ